MQDIKSDLRRLQRENYDSMSRNLEIPIGKTVYAPNTFQIPHTAVIDSDEECTNTLQPVPQSELATVAFHFGEYLLQCSHCTSVASEACKFVYNEYPPAGDILSGHEHLRGSVASCPYLFLSGGTHSGTCNITVESDLFLQLK